MFVFFSWLLIFAQFFSSLSSFSRCFINYFCQLVFPVDEEHVECRMLCVQSLIISSIFGRNLSINDISLLAHCFCFNCGQHTNSFFLAKSFSWTYFISLIVAFMWAKCSLTFCYILNLFIQRKFSVSWTVDIPFGDDTFLVWNRTLNFVDSQHSLPSESPSKYSWNFDCFVVYAAS